jgi:hypothetical protein
MKSPSNGMAERDFTVGEVPGVLRSPASGADRALLRFDVIIARCARCRPPNCGCTMCGTRSGEGSPPSKPDRSLRNGRPTLRRREQAAPAATLTFAGSSRREKTRRLAEPSAHDDDLRLLAHQPIEAAGLHRGRLTALALRDEDLISADQVARQISPDGAPKPDWSPKQPSTASGTSSGPVSSVPPPSSAAPRDPARRPRRQAVTSTRPHLAPLLPSGCCSGPILRPTTTPSPGGPSRRAPYGPITAAVTGAG